MSIEHVPAIVSHFHLIQRYHWLTLWWSRNVNYWRIIASNVSQSTGEFTTERKSLVKQQILTGMIDLVLKDQFQVLVFVA